MENDTSKERTIGELLIKLANDPSKTRLLWEVLESNRDGFMILCKGGTFIYVNKKAGQLLRRNPQYLAGKLIWAELPELSNSPLQTAFESALQTGKYTCIEEYFYPFSRCWFTLDIYPSVEGLFVFIRDITRTKETQLALQQSEEKYRLVIEQALDAIFICDWNGWFLYVNSRACEMSGYTKEELMQKNYIDLLPPDRRAVGRNKFRLLQNGPQLYKDGQLLRKDGSVMYVEICAQYTSDGNVVSISHDITKRKIAEEALKQSEEKHRLLFQQSPLPMFVMDLENYYFLDVNEAATIAYGYTKEEFLNLRALDIRPKEDYDKFFQRVTLAQTGLVSAGQFRHIKKNGQLIDVEIYSHDFLFDNRPSRLVLAIDVTEKLKAEREFLKTTAQLRELSGHLQNIREEERTNIAREIHDELGQQLTILKMDISWLHKKLSAYTDAAMLARTNETLNMLNDTIKSVRRIATQLRPSMLDDLGLVAAIEWQSKEFEARSGIKISFKSNVTQVPIEPTIATSLFRIYQEALTNIGRHANAKNVWSKLKLGSNEVVLMIKDDGRGFDMRSLGSKKTLGILGMKERTIMMGGQFDIYSAPSEGTTIVVTTSLTFNSTTENPRV